MISLAPKSESSIERILNGFEGSEVDRVEGHHTPYSQRNIQQSIEFMMRHQDQPLQVATLASVANLSPSHYFAVFKQVTGFTPMDFFIRLRIQRACELLIATCLCVKEVAAALGYDDPFYFSRVFRSVAGVAPTEYRRLETCHQQEIRAASLPARNGCASLIQSHRKEWDGLVKRSHNFP